MKALLLADWYTAKRFLWLNTLLALAFMAGAVGVEDATGIAFALCAVVVTATVPQSVADYDGQSRWDRYVQTLPCTRGQLVTAKFLEGLVCVGAVWTYGTVLFCAKAALGQWAWSSTRLVSALVLAVGLLVVALCLTSSFCLGLARGQLVFSVCIALTGLSGGTLALFGVRMPSMRELTAGPQILLLPLTAAVFFAGSWALSVRWYKKREL